MENKRKSWNIVEQKKMISSANYFQSLTFENSIIRLLKTNEETKQKQKKARIGRTCTRKIVIIEVSTIGVVHILRRQKFGIF